MSAGRRFGTSGNSVEFKYQSGSMAASLQPNTLGSAASSSATQRSASSAAAAGGGGVQAILADLKASLASRGARGIVGLGRKFRIMDDDGSKSLDMSEFTKAMRECALTLSGDELSVLFRHFDKDGSGTIGYEEFLGGVRGTMNERRRGLVALAFGKIDKDGSGEIEPDDIVSCYDASKHPEVMAGKKTADQVFREFLDTFDVGGEKDGKVTRQEFENYYANVSSSIDNDDYFELMIRNAWHITGGEGWCANSANRRVLVTDSQGRQSVQEIKDDLGVKADDKDEMVRRLVAQGVDVSGGIAVTSGGDDGVDGGGSAGARVGPSRAKPASIGAHVAAAKPAALSDRDRVVAMMGSRTKAQPSAAAAARNAAHSAGTPRPNSQTSPVRRGSPRTAPSSNGASAGLISIIVKLKAELAGRGARGIVGLSRKFRIMDDDGSKSLSQAEFNKAMNEMDMGLSNSELRMLFQHFDGDGGGTIDFEEFVQGVRDPMNNRRRALVDQAFSKIDKDGSGAVEPHEIADAYDASQHPEVIAGRLTPDEVFREFLDTFDVGGEKDGKVTRDEFQNYYHNISASIDNDDYFELMIRNAWHISGGEGWCANSANRRVLVTDSQGQQSVQEITDDLGIKADDKDEMMRRLRAQGLDVAAIATTSGGDDGVDEGGAAAGPFKRPEAAITTGNFLRSSGVMGAIQQDLTVGGVSEARGADPFDDASSPTKGGRSGVASVGLATIISKLKAELAGRGARGIVGLSRKFRIMDDDGSKSLDRREFNKAMNEMNMGLTATEKRMLFDHFDGDGGGTIDFEEFVQGVRDPLNERRLGLVRLAFAKIDKDGSGEVTPDEIVDAYDASAHPEVIAGRMTPEQVFREFLDTFDVGGEKDGKVTTQEFINYYTNIGASIDNDDYFELMIRNAWHISGGEGWCANTTCRRVLVTDRQGRQSVKEIKDDLGVKSDDKQEMMRRLRAQGVNASDIELFSGGDDGVDGGGDAGPTGAATAPAPTRFGRMQAQAAKKRADTHSPWATNYGSDPKASGGSLLEGAGRRTVGASRTFKSSVHFGGDTPNNLLDPYGQKARGGGGGSSGPQVDFATVTPILDNLKAQLAARGARGIVGLGRKFRIMDDDKSESLDVSEFTKAMNECSLDLSDADLQALFGYFDRDGSGDIDYEEFLNGVRGTMNTRRQGLVRQAFAKMDKDGSGEIRPDDIVDAFDASQHPDVIAGTKTPEQVFREFLDTFDVGGEKDGVVTKTEWMNYYNNVSASVDNDDYFELMIRNAWHISGGEGWCANSANRRVLVTDSRGQQSVQEIKDDLGVKADDKDEMVRRLRAQGVDVAAIATTSGGDDGVDSGGGGGGGGSSQSLASAAPPRQVSNTFSSSIRFG